jgi:hypothetical protein
LVGMPSQVWQLCSYILYLSIISNDIQSRVLDPNKVNTYLVLWKTFDLLNYKAHVYFAAGLGS